MYNIPNGDYFEKLLKDDPDVHYVDVTLSLSPFRKKNPEISEFKAIVKRFDPNVVHSHLYLGEVLARSFMSTTAQYFSHCHDNMEQLRNWNWARFPKKSDFSDFYEKKYLLKKYKKNGGTTFIAISKDSFQYAKKTLPNQLAQKVKLLPNAVNFSEYSNLFLERKKDHLNLVNIGSLVDKKNQTFLLDVMFHLKEKGHSVHLDLLGEGVSRQKLENKIKRLKLEKEVTLHGYSTEAHKYLEKAVIYVHSAKYEPFGLVLIEAMASGLPVVALNGKGNSDIVKDGENGFLVQQENIPEFAEKVITLFEDKTLYDSMTKYGVKFAQTFDIVPYVDKLLSIYKKSFNQ